MMLFSGKNIRKMIISIIAFFYSLLSIAQHDQYPAGTRLRALGDGTVALADRWSCFSNPAALGYVKEISAGIYFENRFNLKELNTGAFTFNLPLGHNHFNLNFYSFNNSVIYTRQKIGIAYSLLLSGNLSAGVQFHLLRTDVEDYGNSLGFCGEFGLFYKPGKRISVGADIFNPTLSKYSDGSGERIPTVIKAGLAYQVSQQSFIIGEVLNSSTGGYSARGGVEYMYKSKLSLSMGIASAPFKACFGLGMRYNHLRIGLSLQYMQALDATPGAGIDYVFKEYSQYQ